MSFSPFRILPLLIFVSMITFMVRFVEVIDGVKTVSGAAYAAEKKEAEHGGGAKEKKKEGESAGSSTVPLPPPIEGPMDADKKGSLQFPDVTESAGKDKAPMKDTGKPIGWTDASESDMGGSDVRKDLTEELTRRREDLERRERELQTKEALLRAGQQELERKFTEMTQLRGEIEKLLNTQSEEEKARIMSLVKIYEGMKAAEAARIFNTLDLDVLLQVVSKMSERKLSPILGQMEAERAKTITIMLAQQKQLPTLPATEAQ